MVEADCEVTTGLRIDNVVQYWADHRGWIGMDDPKSGRGVAAVVALIVARMEALILEHGQPMPGAMAAIQYVTSLKHSSKTTSTNSIKLGLVSSSPKILIQASLQALGITDYFDVIASGEDEEYGKPHPAVYLTAATHLGVAPTRCIAIEDSVTGMVAAKAARMACIAVPAVPALLSSSSSTQSHDEKGQQSEEHVPAPHEPARQFGLADIVLRSLKDLDGTSLHAAVAGA